jgi:hypothetical protein
MIRAGGVLAVAVAISGAGLCAQSGDLLKDIEKLKDPKVGQWVLYEMRDAARGAKLTMRQSIVGKETMDGKDVYWLETDIMPRKGDRMVTKILFKDYPSDPANILKIIEKLGDEPPREVPVPKLEERSPTAKTGRAEKVRGKEIGKETFNTRTGSVEARHFKVEDPAGTSEIWTSDKVGLSGVVRKVGPSGEMILIAYGDSGAQSAISGSQRGFAVREQTDLDDDLSGKESRP